MTIVIDFNTLATVQINELTRQLLGVERIVKASSKVGAIARSERAAGSVSPAAVEPLDTA